MTMDIPDELYSDIVLALNWMRDTKIPGTKLKSTYELAAALGKLKPTKESFKRIIPVISTGHVKETTASELLADCWLVASYEEGYFVYMDEGDDEYNDHPEMLPIRDWLRREHPDASWVAFDSAGDQIGELPVFDW